MEITIHGLGYVGLTAAIAYAEAGFTVIGHDTSHKHIRGLRTGVTSKDGKDQLFAQVSEKLPDYLDQIAFTTNVGDTFHVDTHLICVPTEKDDRPHTHIVEALVDAIASNAEQPSLIIVESTLIPGTMKRLTSNLYNRQLEVGKDVFLAAAPRRDWFPDDTRNLHTIPRVVGGATPACTMKAAVTLQYVSPDLIPTDMESAELCKPVENYLYHAIIRAAYEVALAFPDQDVNEVLRLAGTHWRIPNLHLGFGVGGRCVPLAAKYLLEGSKAHDVFSFAEYLIKSEYHFRAHVADVAHRLTTSGQTIGILGIGYRPGFKDAGSSPAQTISAVLRLKTSRRAVYITDPLWDIDDLMLDFPHEMIGIPDRGTDLFLVSTPHEEYVTPDFWSHVIRPDQTVLDASGTLRSLQPLFSASGVRYIQVGSPGWSKHKPV